MNTAVITGAGGFIGGALAQYLLGKGVTVFGVDIALEPMKTLCEHENFIPVQASFQEYDSLADAINIKKQEGQSIDVFYHFAWQGVFGEPFKDYKLQLNNAAYSCQALEQAIAAGAKKFVFAGSMNEYEMDAYIGADHFEPRYTYVYSVAKQASEAICKTLAFHKDIAFCAGRIAMAYCENNRSMMVPNVVMKNMLANIPCKLVKGDNLYDMIYIDDIVRAFEAIGEKGKPMKSYYIGHRTQTTFRSIIEQIGSILNPECPLLFGEYPDVPSGVDYKYIDTDSLYRDTGFECTANFRQSILNTAQWLQQANL